MEGNKIVTPRGVILISPEDVGRVARRGWRINKHGYPETGGNGESMELHEFLMGKAPKGQHTDHINRNKLDNRRENLRFVSARVNAQNAGLRSDNTSGVRGVRWYKRSKKWHAAIFCRGRTRHLGYFESFYEAVATRLLAEKELWAES